MSQTNRRPQQRPGAGRPAARPAGYARNARGSRGGRPSMGNRGYNGGKGKPATASLSGHFTRDLLILAAGGLAAIIIALVLQSMWPDGFPLDVNRKVDGSVKEISEIYSTGPLRINEIMTADRYSVMDEEDAAVDWIEVMNIGSSGVNLEGYQLAKTSGASSVFTFPSMTLAPHECVIVFADSKLRNTAGEELHAPFRLSSGGDTLMLFNASGTAIDTVNIPPLGRDISYARKDTSVWVVCDQPTPALDNTEENYRALTEPASDSPIILNEIAARNKTILADENGQYYDYIELYNRSGEPVDISGWYLSDNDLNSRRWRFPNMTMQPGEYLVVFASGLDRTGDPSHLHTNFSLSSEGEIVILSDRNGRRMDMVSFDLIKGDSVYARQPDGSWAMASGTPGSAN